MIRIQSVSNRQGIRLVALIDDFLSLRLLALGILVPKFKATINGWMTAEAKQEIECRWLTRFSYIFKKLIYKSVNGVQRQKSGQVFQDKDHFHSMLWGAG